MSLQYNSNLFRPAALVNNKNLEIKFIYVILYLAVPISTSAFIVMQIHINNFNTAMFMFFLC